MALLDRHTLHPSPIEWHRLRLDGLWEGGALLRFAADALHPCLFLALPAATLALAHGSAHQRLALLAQVPRALWEGPVAADTFDPLLLPFRAPSRRHCY